MTTIERVAKALQEVVIFDASEEQRFKILARIAIETMREPTDEMMQVFKRPLSATHELKCYKAMIDAALKESP